MSNLNRIVFLGTPDFSVPILHSLVESGYQVVGVVSQPDRPVGRKRVLEPTPVKQAAQALGLPLIQPERIRHEEAFETLTLWSPDVLITAAYGQLIPERILHLPKIASLNVHASLLPYYRGASPIQRAILNGDKRTGVSIMTMVKEMDAGPVWAQESLELLPDENYGELSDRLSTLGAALLLKTLPDIVSRAIQPTEQDESRATFAPRLTREDEWLDFTKNANDVANKVRALAPSPGASVWLGDKVLKVWYATPVEMSTLGSEPGQVLAVTLDGIVVACRTGAVVLSRVQAAGKRAMSGLEFSRGFRNLTGSVFRGKQEKGEP